MKSTVVIGLLGTTLDFSPKSGRWDRWRPSVSVCQHSDLLVKRFELLYQRQAERLVRTIAEDIRSISPETEVIPRRVEFTDPWDFEEVYGALHDFARGYPFHTDEEDYLVHITTGSHVQQICLFLLTESRHLPARLLQTSPPSKRDGGPGTYRLIDLDLSRYDRIAQRFAGERREGLSFLKSGIETRNAQFNRLVERIESVAIRSRDPILLMGPTGAGKTLLARRIYDLKRARNQVEGAYVELNCATLRGEAAMSALFGHVRGAFTGALRDRPGLLRAAHRGVLMLDEIGELGPDEQAMLLRALEEKKFLPLGSDREAESEFQLIAGTNRDLHADAGFRDDLLSRIQMWTFRLPGLRQRPEDIEPNLEFELERLSGAVGTRLTMNREARDRFLGFAAAPDAAWRGNFRDLIAAVTRMATLAEGGRITQEIAEEEIGRLRLAWRRSEEDEAGRALGADRAAALDRFDRVQLSDVIALCRQAESLSDAGRQLFAQSRRRKKAPNDADRLRKYLARFGLDFEAIRRLA